MAHVRVLTHCISALVLVMARSASRPWPLEEGRLGDAQGLRRGQPRQPRVPDPRRLADSQPVVGGLVRLVRQAACITQRRTTWHCRIDRVLIGLVDWLVGWYSPVIRSLVLMDVVVWDKNVAVSDTFVGYVCDSFVHAHWRIGALEHWRTHACQCARICVGVLRVLTGCISQSMPICCRRCRSRSRSMVSSNRIERWKAGSGSRRRASLWARSA
mgnify:CR=1 FL=1